MSPHVYPMISSYLMESLDLSSRYLSLSLRIITGAQSRMSTIKPMLTLSTIPRLMCLGRCLYYPRKAYGAPWQLTSRMLYNCLWVIPFTLPSARMNSGLVLGSHVYPSCMFCTFLSFSLSFVRVKGTDTICTLVFSQNNCWHKNLLSNEQWRAIDRIKHCEKHCEKRLPLK